MIEGILALLDSRSFGSIWFWLVLALVWSLAGRRVAGVPYDIVQGARKQPDSDEDHPAAFLLLDWLSLTLPRRHLGRTEGLVMLFVATFAMSALFLLGFVYGLEMAQALVLLVLPFLILVPVELRLTRKLLHLVEAAGAEQLAVNEAARQAAHLMRWHRAFVTLISIIVVAVTAYRGALWFIAHPFGF
ncbi:hypothetical protein [Paracoccus aestuariivivens]|uniref:hypothetical protein n=1 Tax=Paracoccus aestuariivivens TaxID=1820333 RepID=UPI001FEC6FF4|nr:hypothetical protein [Paracoccus aestuariivivens]